MRNLIPFPGRGATEDYEQLRERMLTETAAFIAWGLRQPYRKHWIPVVPVGRARFSEALKRTFWAALLSEES